MVSRHADSAKKALSLKKDIVFRLLVLMMALLGWLCAIAGSSMVMLENAYENWHLEQKSHINIYLDADEDRGSVIALVEELSGMVGVKRAYLLGENEVRDILQPYFKEETSFPLPFVIDATVSDKLDREHFNNKVEKYFENAAVDDARKLLYQVNFILRFIQITAMGVATVLLIVMAVLVSLTIRAGLRGKQDSLQTMQYIGATDEFLVSLVTRQSFIQSLKGWFCGSALAVATMVVFLKYWPFFNEYVDYNVWGAIVLAPFILSFVASLSAWITAKRIVRQLT
jgi:cell division protein FtsX